MMCSKCVMDDSNDPNISFDKEGLCNYCVAFRDHPKSYGVRSVDEGLSLWAGLVQQMKREGEGKRADCIIGVSAGIDSSYVSYVAHEYGLKALLVHASNGFDSPVSQRNMKRILEHTDFELEKYTVDFEEFKSVQLAFLRASVIDTDVPSDYLIEAFIRKTALKNDIHYVLSGGNYFADAFMPTAWNYPNKHDFTNIRNINRRFGNGLKLKSFPKHGTFKVLWNKNRKKLRYVTPLNYIGYHRFEALKTLQKEWGYEAYGHKHGENIFTRFYQRHILPLKFGVDKRRANYSNYIRSGGLTREEALAKLEKPLYDPQKFEEDKTFVLVKLGLSEIAFKVIMDLPQVPHEAFGTDEWMFTAERWVKHVLRPVLKLYRMLT